MKLYFSHPTFTFNTKTERKCIRIIKKTLKPDEVVNPSDFGLTHDIKGAIKESDAMVGMAVEGKYTFLVWNEMDLADSLDMDLYTFMVKDKSDIGPLVEGMPEKIKRLSKEESKKFNKEITTGYRDSIFSVVIGNWGSKRF